MQINYDQLHAIERDIKRIVATSPFMGLFLRPHIEKFFQRNAIRLELLHERLAALQRKYIVHDEDGRAQRVEAANGEGEWVFLEPDERLQKLLIKEDCKLVGDLYYKEAAEFLVITFKVEI